MNTNSNKRKINHNYLWSILLLAGLFYNGTLASQNLPQDVSEYPYWFDMMQDPKANFYETQRAFEAYWEGREIQKGNSWKVFKRWESFMETRIDFEGNKPAPDHNLNEYISYYGSTDKSFSADGGHGNWIELGPVSSPANGTTQPNGLGRVNCIAFHPSNNSIMYIGAPSGGFWRTFNGGSSWETTTDNLSTLGVSSILVNHTRPNTLFLGTGDRDGGDAPGIGMMKSYDGGDSWSLSNTGMGNRTVGRILMHPSDTSIILAATSGGIYRSTNGGQNWSRTSSNSSNYKDLVFKPGDPNIVYATAYGDFYRSTNNGVSWTYISSGFSSSDSRLAIGVSPDDPSVVYCLSSAGNVYGGLYRSTDSGLNFTLMSSTPNILDYSTNGSGTSGQGLYDLCIAVDPNNVDIIYAGGINIFKSTNAGSTWTINAHWTGSGGADDIHADQHELVYSPQGYLYSGNDGGIYRTTNGGSTWNDISSGLAIAQVYKLGQSASTSNLAINGYQDNGTSVYDGSWSTEIGGDGMECIVDYTTNNYMYGALYYGDVRRSSNGGSSFYTIAKNGSNGINESGAWVTPYILDNSSASTMYIGYRNIWRSTNIKSFFTFFVSWSKLSDNLGGTNSSTIRVLEQSPANSNLLYFSRADGRFFRSDNIQAGSPSYTDLTASRPTSTWPRDIEAHPTDEDIVWVVQSNSVFESSDKGASWTDISGTLPNVSVNCIVYDESTGDLYVGTDLGVFLRENSASDWIDYNSGLPLSVEVTELEIYYNANRSLSRLKASTYGRGMWESELYTAPVANFTVSDASICEDDQVTFSDASSGTYNSLSWTFTSGVPASSTDRNPQVTYPSAGTYPVQLSISNDLEGDVEVKNSYITVSSCGARQTLPLGLSGNGEETSIRVFPNPASSTVSVDLTGGKGDEFEIVVTDASGKTVISRKVSKENGQNILELNIEKVTAGIFFIQVRNEEEQAVFRMVRQ